MNPQCSVLLLPNHLQGFQSSPSPSLGCCPSTYSSLFVGWGKVSLLPVLPDDLGGDVLLVHPLCMLWPPSCPLDLVLWCPGSWLGSEFKFSLNLLLISLNLCRFCVSSAQPSVIIVAVPGFDEGGVEDWVNILEIFWEAQGIGLGFFVDSCDCQGPNP